MKAVILASGMESNLDPLTQIMPGAMIPLVNRPTIEYAIEWLARHEIKDLILSLYHTPHQIERFVGDGSRWGVHITCSLEREPQGAAGALRRIAAALDDTVVVVESGIVTNADLGAAIQAHRRRQAQITLLLRPAAGDDAGALSLDPEGRILPSPSDQRPRLASTGVSILEPAVLTSIPPRGVVDLERDVLPRLLASGAPCYGVTQPEAHWARADRFASYHQAQAAILRGQVSQVRVPGQQTAPGVWQGRDAAIHPQARIVPPVAIGDHCQIRADVVVGPEVVLGNNVIIDQGATLAHSTVLDGTYVGRLVDVQDALVHRNLMVKIPDQTSVFVSDRFLLGYVGEEPLLHALGRAAEWTSALLLFVLTLPLWPIAALLSRLSGRGPILVKEPCATSDLQALQETGQPAWRAVDLLRFRAGANSAGRLLVRASANALPLLLHVLRGDVSLVGVGPMSPEQAALLVEDWQMQRFRRPAGLTGLWYVSSSQDLSPDEQLLADSYYAVTRTWRQDLRILWQTPRAWWRRALRRLENSSST